MKNNKHSVLLSLFFIITLYTTYLSAFDFPPLPGPFKTIGTVNYHLIDESRPEYFAYRGIEARELMIQIWYPSQGKAHKPSSPYIPKLLPYIKDMITKRTWIPMFALNYVLQDAYTHAQEGVSLLSDPKMPKFPIVIFSHGIGSNINFYTTLLEALASYGYIVVGINHTYDCCVSVFPEGQAVLANENYEENIFKYVMKRTDVWVKDVQFVLDELVKINARDPKKILTDKLDLSNVGMFGHSMGGSVATQVCRREPRIKAGVNMDGPLLGEDAIEPFTKPFMFLLASASFKYAVTSFLNQERVDWGITLAEEAEFKKRYSTYIPALCCYNAKQNADVYKITITNTDHNSFSDLPLLKKTSWLFRFVDFNTGTIDPDRSLKIINDYLVVFFDKYLKGRPAPLLETYCQGYGQEVIMEKWKS